jgi:hypothetical protein
MRPAARRILVGVGLAIALACASAAWAWSRAYSSVVRRHSTAVADLPGYGDELRRLEPYGESPSDPDPHRGPTAYAGSGWYSRRSPDGRHVAVTTSWGGVFEYTFLGLVVDRPFYHTVAVWDEKRHSLIPVVSIKESDPASGIAHRYAWSRDSEALLIHGSGSLPEDYATAMELCEVYLPAKDQLFRIKDCPPVWQRGGR